MSEIRVNNIIDEAGTGAPTFPNGATGNLTGNVTGTATTATALSGTPNITVGTVTGTDATFSGNLTVNGTTTTIDTAVTSVDSLAVDGSVGIGTTNPIADLTITGTNGTNMEFQADLNSGLNRITNFNRSTTAYKDFRIDALSQQFYISGTEKLRIDQHGTSKFSGPLTEKCNRDGGAGLTGNYIHHLKTYGNVHWATNNSSGTWTYDITGDGSTDLNDMMTDQETLSFQLISAQNNASYYMTELRIDGSNAHTVWWQGGSAPSAGGASGYDVYTFTIFKRLNASFRIFASVTNHG